MFKKVLFFLTLLLLITIACEVQAVQSRDIIILYTNDVHCGVEDFIGYAGLAYYKEQMKALTPYVTLVDAGDAVQGATIGTISNGRYIIEIMNAMNYDIAVPGNHEFDYGMEQFWNFAKNLSCGYVCSNFKDTLKDKPVFEPYKILSYGDTKIAFVGACTPLTVGASVPSNFIDSDGKFVYDFDTELSGKKLCASIQSAVDNARTEGADYVILVGHLGEDIAVENWSAPFVVANTRGIDAVIDGHSHQVTPCMPVKNLDGKEIPITQTGTKLRYIGRMTIKPSGEITTGLIDSVSGRDEKIASLIADIKARYEGTLNKKYGHASFELVVRDSAGQWINRNGENTLSNLVADALLAASEGSADIALINAGGVRGNINSGDITYNDILRVNPYPNTICICEVSGQTILDELEFGAARIPEKFGGFLHASGLTYEVDTSVPSPVQVDDKNMLAGISGERRVKVSNVKVNGKGIEPDKKYSVISVSHILLNNGDGHKFRGAVCIKPDFMVIADAVAQYIKSLKEIPERYRTPQGRIIIK